jgi:hypothetical protein
VRGADLGRQLVARSTVDNRISRYAGGAERGLGEMTRGFRVEIWSLR